MDWRILLLRIARERLHFLFFLFFFFICFSHLTYIFVVLGACVLPGVLVRHDRKA